MQNGFIELCNRSYREAVLNMYIFETLDDVRTETEKWLGVYSQQRPHESLGTFSTVENLRNSSRKPSSELASLREIYTASRATGAIPFRVIFNEEGKVIFAQSIFGHPSLKSAAAEAAMKSTFEPFELDGKIIKVSGVILYNFRP